MNASRKAFLLGLCMAASAMSVPALTIAGVVVDIDVAPPPVRVESVPPPRAGYVWAPGFWAWRGGQHVWVGGRWIGERAGYRWVPDRWEPRGPHWHHIAGHWER